MAQQLQIVMAAKIALTLGIWSLPLLLFSEKSFTRMGFPQPGSMVFLRLLGVAYGALACVYALGLKGVLDPAIVRGIGWVSNGGAFVILCVARREWTGWGLAARTYMMASQGLTGSIAAALMFIA